MLINWNIECPLTSQNYSMFIAVADMALRTEGVSLPCSISVTLCNDERIHAINKEFRNVDRSTDVLSFPSVNWPKGKTAGNSVAKLKASYDDESATYYLGDIVISVEHTIRQAQEFGHSENRELAYLLTHSMFHLMGYDHMIDEEKRVMRTMEEKSLESLGISRANELLDGNDASLISLAKEAMKSSYSPYSHFPVGAALRCTDGRIYLGCNIENASFGLTNCAERTAIFKAISDGARSFDAIAIASNSSAPWPCGACRQVLNEFAPELRVIVTWDGNVAESSLSTLLPHGFGPDSLEKK